MRATFSRAFAAAITGIAACALAEAQTETVVVTGSHDDPCLIVAGAKAAQWGQAPLMIRETRTFADGGTKQSEIIFTHDEVYAHYVGKVWGAKQFLVPERRLKSADAAAERMRLDACHLVETDEENGAPAKVYAFSYKPDADGSTSEGQIWIADATGLPVRQELNVNAARADPARPVRFAATFLYGDAVKIPLGAQLAEDSYRIRVQQQVRGMQEGRDTMGP